MSRSNKHAPLAIHGRERVSIREHVEQRGPAQVGQVTGRHAAL
jgi:hypothetical protein